MGRYHSEKENLLPSDFDDPRINTSLAVRRGGRQLFIDAKLANYYYLIMLLTCLALASQ